MLQNKNVWINVLGLRYKAAMKRHRDLVERVLLLLLLYSRYRS